MSQSGLPLEEALLAVSQQNETPRTKSILLGVRGKVMEGHTLADGLAEFPQAFPELYRATVARLGIAQPAVPLVVIGDRYFLGYDRDTTTGQAIARAVGACSEVAPRSSFPTASPPS